MRFTFIAFVLITASIGGSDAAQARQAASPTDQRRATSAAEQNHLEPGDVIRLRIWREENMSGEF
ncbi:MAG: hypothetical protein KFH98_16610, partial [Gemmatimonadetes bacterium]|nr:hypothetical protein [Gemmatimonadota bacterium]